jgi:aspartyl-tRNA(Asn)/glutamyl-tRNA(Gln) amidotransferase subunit A
MPPHTIASAAAALREGRITSVELTTAALDVIAARNGATNAFILVDRPGALARAAEADAERARGVDLGPLHGVPMSVKDLIDVAGQATTAASRVFARNIATADAPVVTRLRAAGAVLVGKTNLHEFALGTTSEDSAWGPVRHPKDPSRVAGGSSGGSAVAVATGMSVASVGTDTGGSIRIPASACGVVGLKPSFGDIPTDGVIPLSVSLDHMGPLTSTVDDARTVWQILAGRSSVAPEARAISTVRIGRLGGYFGLMAPDVAAAFMRAIDTLQAGGVQVEDVEVGGADMIADVYVRIVLPEAATWHAQRLDKRESPYSPAVRARLEGGRLIPAVDYLHALESRETLRRSVDALLEVVDVLVLPTLPIVAPILGQDMMTIDHNDIPVRSAMLRNTQLFNLTGHPAISLPLDAGGWPCGVQIVGRRGETAGLLTIAESVENVTGAARM